MNFYDQLKSLGLFQAPQSGMQEAYGLTPELMRQARMSSLGNIGAQVMAASMPMTTRQRSQMLSNSDWTGGYNTNLYNAAQMQLLSNAQRRRLEEEEQQGQARAWLAEKIKGMPAGQKRDGAMVYLEMGDLDRAAQLVAEPPPAAAPTELKTIRSGDKEITYQWDAGAGQWMPFSEGPAFKPEVQQPPSSVKEYEYAKSQGYDGSYQDFLKMATAAKAGVALPAEMGARIGLGDEFLNEDLPGIKEDVQAGTATGVVDYLTGWAGRGRQGEIRRRLLTGVDALRRNLTGAGMSATETEEYVGRYLPSITDDAETLASKISGLERDLRAVKDGAVAGKSGAIVRDQSTPEAKKRLKFNPATGELE